LFPLQRAGQRKALTNPLQEQERVQCIGLAARVGADQHGDPIDVKRRFVEAFPMDQAQFGDHGTDITLGWDQVVPALAQEADRHEAIDAMLNMG